VPPRKTGVPTLAARLEEIRSKRSIKIGSLADFDMTVKSISTGNVAIDAITNVGGLPRGRIIECYGPPSSGKTTTALQAAACLQQSGGKILFLDYEKSLDQKYVKALGVDPTDESSFIYMQPDTFEEGANVFRDLMRSGELDMVIVDSVAAMVTEKELEADTGKVSMADRAKMMHQFMRQIVGQVNKHQLVVVFLNHVLEVIDASPMGQKLKAAGVVRKTTPGGQALKFYSSMRIEYKQVGNIRGEVYDPISNEKMPIISQVKVQVTVVKNKVAPPFGQCEVRVRYGRGFSQAYSVLDVLIAHGAVKKKAAGVHVFPVELAPSGDEPYQLQGEETVLSAIESNPDWLTKLEAYACRLLSEFGTFKADPTEWAHEDTEGVHAQPIVPEGVNTETGEMIEHQD